MPNAEAFEDNSKRALPEDPGEFDKAIAPMRVMVRPVLKGISRMAMTLGTSELDRDELESGTVAFSALAYQYGTMLDARVLVAIWIASIVPSRVIELAEKRKARLAQQRATYLRPPLQDVP